MTDMAATIIVPTYRRPRQLQACLRAVETQTFREPWEVIVVDDGSPETPDIRRDGNPARRDWRVVRQANAGPASARNLGVREARGEWIAFTDDDCLPEPSWLETLVRAARERPTSLVGGTTLNGLRDDLFASTSQMIVDLVYEHFNADPNDAYFLASNNILCARDRFLDIGGFDERFPRAGAEDRDFCDRWRMQNWPLVWVPEARIEHRHPQTLSKFLNLHVRYGRGAYRYQAIRRARASGTMREDLGFHKTLPRRVWHRLGQRGSPLADAGTVAALIAWQAANAAGFFMEASIPMRTRERGGPGTEPAGDRS